MSNWDWLFLIIIIFFIGKILEEVDVGNWMEKRRKKKGLYRNPC